MKWPSGESERVYWALKDSGPITPNRITDDLHSKQKTRQIALMELENSKDDVHWKKVGRYRLFWKERPKGK